MHCVGVPLYKYIRRVYRYIYMCVYLIYESIASRAFVGWERPLNSKEKNVLEEYILVKIYLSSAEVLLFQKMD